MAPLSAQTYLNAYDELTEPDFQDLQQYVDDLAPYPLIPSDTLESTWPGAGWVVSYLLCTQNICL